MKTDVNEVASYLTRSSGIRCAIGLGCPVITGLFAASLGLPGFAAAGLMTVQAIISGLAMVLSILQSGGIESQTKNFEAVEPRLARRSDRQVATDVTDADDIRGPVNG